VAQVTVDLSVSLDGFIAGPDDGLQHPLGRGGEALFAWMGAGPPTEGVDERLAPPPASQVVIDEWVSTCGAMISGRRTFDIAGGWAGGHPIDAPIVVLTHEPPTSGEWSPQVRFATTLDDALVQARDLAGDGLISVCGADVAKQLLAAGALDRIQLSVTPVLLGGGVRLFDLFDGPVTLEQTRVIPSDGVTHLRYSVVKG
jgi:dihydrofolate reductase